MRIITEPKVYLVGRPQIIEEGLEAFLHDNELVWPTPTENVTSSERLVEIGGRNCYMSYGKKAGSKTNRKYIQNLIGINEDGTHKEGPAHGSVCEHPVWNFLVTGCGKAFAQEQERHRAGWAYSELSTRYCDFEREKEDGTWEPGFCVPPLGQLSEYTRTLFESKFKSDQQWYCEVLCSIESDLKHNSEFMARLCDYSEKEQSRILRKAARGAARDILPIGIEAILMMSGNARAIWNCISLRATEHAEAVIRNVYVQIAKIMEREMPSLFSGLVYKKCWDGSEVVELPRDKL